MSFFLFVHLVGAVIVSIFTFLALVALLTKSSAKYSFYAKSIAISGAFQLVSGSLLGWSIHSNLFAFCTRIGMYLGVILLTEMVLFMAMKKYALPFPSFQVASSLSFGVLFVIITIINDLYR